MSVENLKSYSKLKAIMEKVEAKKSIPVIKESIQLSSKEALIGSYSLLNEDGVDEYLNLNIVKNNSNDKLSVIITNEDDTRVIEHLLPAYKSIKEVNSFLNKKGYYVNKSIYDPFDLMFNLV